ncbi:hypothetical protein I3843_07G085800 [Carya illinoinensis]|nr:hypothetical protein I3843_07G085800 [Carya illinoinensis]
MLGMKKSLVPGSLKIRIVAIFLSSLSLTLPFLLIRCIFPFLFRNKLGHGLAIQELFPECAGKVWWCCWEAPERVEKDQPSTIPMWEYCQNRKCNFKMCLQGPASKKLMCQ